MKAVQYEAYGGPDVIHIREVAQPTPKDDGVLVAVHAAAINSADWRYMRADPAFLRLEAGLFKPKRRFLGMAFAGRVAAVGANVGDFQPGDEVYGEAFGAYAEYVTIPAARLARKPKNMNMIEAATVPLGGTTALTGVVKHGQVQAGQKVLVNGAAGGVGSFAVQIAKAHGAEVTGVASTSKLDLVRQMGADHVIDYTKDDPTQTGARYDLILDTAAFRPLGDWVASMNPGGAYIMAGGAMTLLLGIAIFGKRLGKRVGDGRFMNYLQNANRDDLVTLREMIEAGQIVAPVDQTFPLDEAAAAMRYYESGRVSGKVVIRVVV